MTYLHNIYTYLHKYLCRGKTIWRHREKKTLCKSSREASEKPASQSLTLGLWLLELCGKTFLLFHPVPVCGTVLWQSWWTPDLSMFQQALFEIRSLHKAGTRWEQVSRIVWETSWQPDWHPRSGGYAGDICMVGTGSLQLCEFRHPWVSPPTEDENLPPVLAWALPLCWACARCTEACLLPPSSSPLERAWYLFIGWDMEVYEEERMQREGTGRRMWT